MTDKTLPTRTPGATKMPPGPASVSPPTGPSGWVAVKGSAGSQK